ncbi:probable protein phosphatase 2C 72 [Hibiscus syriacus]|uniref:probable protein phosphatase 2C 72 n=1 Tax=Hibiscus syriacus TaxID=106335 RepID=UPI001920719A|nr:probable protein phosphatase 2C 72 [Hibiscus syriacus]
MGICISIASSEIHDEAEEHNCHENVLYSPENIGSFGVQRLGSLYSKQGSKGLNQDAAILYQDYGIEGGAFCGVFDGHGKNGHFVSNMVRNRLSSLLLSQKIALAKLKTTAEKGGETDPSKDFRRWKEACVSAFKVMDKEIKLQENMDCATSGTTAVVVVRLGEDLVIANLGDSRAVLGTMTENGIKGVQLTIDLKPDLPSESERIRNCKGRVLALKEEPHIQRVWLPHQDSPGLAMSRAFGDFGLKNHGIITVPDVSYHHLTPNDHFIVLASDGVWDVLNNDQVASIVMEAKSEHEAARTVVEAATASWKRKFPSSKVDDCTAVCLFLQNKRHPSFLPEET